MSISPGKPAQSIVILKHQANSLVVILVTAPYPNSPKKSMTTDLTTSTPIVPHSPKLVPCADHSR